MLNKYLIKLSVEKEFANEILKAMKFLNRFYKRIKF